MWLQRGFVGDGLPLHLEPGHVGGLRAQVDGVTRTPLAPVELAEHRTAKVQLVLRGRRTPGGEEAHAQRHAVVEGELGDVANAHVVRQAGAAVLHVGRKAPQRRHAREQHEQRGHDGRTQQRHAPGHAQRLRQRRPPHRHMGVHQRGQQPQQRQQHGGGHGQGLREEEVGQQREEAQKEHHHGITPAVQLQRLEAQQHHDQRYPGVAAQDGAVREQRGAQDQREQQADHPAPWQRAPAPGQLPAPGQQRQANGRGPGGQVARQRQHDPGDHTQQEQRVARVARHAGQGGGEAGRRFHVLLKSELLALDGIGLEAKKG